MTAKFIRNILYIYREKRTNFGINLYIVISFNKICGGEKNHAIIVSTDQEHQIYWKFIPREKYRSAGTISLLYFYVMRFVKNAYNGVSKYF
jgi:hypothetical protein